MARQSSGQSSTDYDCVGSTIKQLDVTIAVERLQTADSNVVKIEKPGRMEALMSCSIAVVGKRLMMHLANGAATRLVSTPEHLRSVAADA